MPKHFPPNLFIPLYGSSSVSHGGVSTNERPTCSKYVTNMSSHSQATINCYPTTNQSSINCYSPIQPSSTSAGVYITQLHRSITSLDLEEIFSKAGPIRKCYVATDKSTGKSLGYGIVHYMVPESARKAIQLFNGFIIKGQEINVETYKNPSERQLEKPFTNLFVKNFEGGITSEAEFLSLFSGYGTISSYKVERDVRTGEIKGYGYVSFHEPDNARLAMMSLNGMMLKNIQTLFVGQHQTREQLQNTKAHQPKFGNLSPNLAPNTYIPYQHQFATFAPNNFRMHTSNHIRNHNATTATITMIPRNNIYVKNLKGFADSSEALFNLFKRFGLIVSAVIMQDETIKTSRGFGFVCFKNIQDATRAINEMNNWKLPNGKLLYCGYAQQKNERQAQLRLKFRANVHVQRQHCIDRRRRNGLSSSSTFLETLCNICFDEKPPSESVLLDCKHVNCKDCLRNWFNILIGEKQISFICPGEDCESPIQPDLIKTLVSKETFESFDKVLLEYALERMDDVIHCPTPGCDSWILIDPLLPTRGACHSCHSVFCTNCTNPYHDLDPCDEFSDEDAKEKVLTDYANGTTELKSKLEQRYGKVKLCTELESRMNKLFLSENCKRCPGCKSNIEKISGCNHMNCWKCKCHFCWICLGIFNESEAYGHVRNANCQPPN